MSDELERGWCSYGQRPSKCRVCALEAEVRSLRAELERKTEALNRISVEGHNPMVCRFGYPGANHGIDCPVTMARRELAPSPTGAGTQGEVKP